jgi:hypothetical protein
LFDVEAVIAAEDLPIHVPQLIARLIHPVLGELDREPTPWGAMQAAEKPLDHTLGDNLQTAELRHL